MAVTLANFFMLKLKAFISGSVMHLCRGCTHRRNYAAVDNILKIINVFKKLDFALFPHAHCALRYTLQ